jgi:hypothetical protein
MSDQSLEQQLAELPAPEEFESLEGKFRHGANTFRQGNKYRVEDYGDIGKSEVFMFWRAGWVKVSGWPETPSRDPARKITLDIHNIKQVGKSPKVGG